MIFSDDIHIQPYVGERLLSRNLKVKRIDFNRLQKDNYVMTQESKKLQILINDPYEGELLLADGNVYKYETIQQCYFSEENTLPNPPSTSKKKSEK